MDREGPPGRRELLSGRPRCWDGIAHQGSHASTAEAADGFLRCLISVHRIRIGLACCGILPAIRSVTHRLAMPAARLIDADGSTPNARILLAQSPTLRRCRGRILKVPP